MLKQRIATALVLVALLGLTLTVAAPYGFPLFALAMSAIVVYEWLLLLAFAQAPAIAIAAVVAAALWALDGSSAQSTVAAALCALATAVWIALSAGLFATGRFPSSDRWRFAYAALAVALPAACWCGLVAAYRQGLVYLVSILAVAWAADVAAYFAGRAFGRRKLAPAISPGKTWAGAIGGALAAVAVASACVAAPALADSFFGVVGRHRSIAFAAPLAMAVALAMAVVSIVGDLFESQLKRQRGVKDSSRLLPGHGGVFDRVDALLPIVPIALLLQRFA